MKTLGVLAWLFSVASFFYAAVAQPNSARCPTGAVLLTGIQRDGTFTCWTPGRGYEARTKRGGWTSVETEAPRPIVESRIYCTSGQQPIVRADGVTVGCQRGGGK